MVVGEAHDILVVTESLFAAGGRHIYLWPEATILYRSRFPTKIGTMVTIPIASSMTELNKMVQTITFAIPLAKVYDMDNLIIFLLCLSKMLNLYIEC